MAGGGGMAGLCQATVRAPGGVSRRSGASVGWANGKCFLALEQRLIPGSVSESLTEASPTTISLGTPAFHLLCSPLHCITPSCWPFVSMWPWSNLCQTQLCLKSPLLLYPTVCSCSPSHPHRTATVSSIIPYPIFLDGQLLVPSVLLVLTDWGMESKETEANSRIVHSKNHLLAHSSHTHIINWKWVAIENNVKMELPAYSVGAGLTCIMPSFMINIKIWCYTHSTFFLSLFPDARQ